MLLWGGEKNFEFEFSMVFVLGGILGFDGILVGGILVFGWESTKPATDHPPLIPWHCLHRIEHAGSDSNTQPADLESAALTN